MTQDSYRINTLPIDSTQLSIKCPQQATARLPSLDEASLRPMVFMPRLRNSRSTYLYAYPGTEKDT